MLKFNLYNKERHLMGNKDIEYIINNLFSYLLWWNDEFWAKIIEFRLGLEKLNVVNSKEDDRTWDVRKFWIDIDLNKYNIYALLSDDINFMVFQPKVKNSLTKLVVKIKDITLYFEYSKKKIHLFRVYDTSEFTVSDKTLSQFKIDRLTNKEIKRNFLKMVKIIEIAYKENKGYIYDFSYIEHYDIDLVKKIAVLFNEEEFNLQMFNSILNIKKSIVNYIITNMKDIATVNIDIDKFVINVENRISVVDFIKYICKIDINVRVDLKNRLKTELTEEKKHKIIDYIKKIIGNVLDIHKIKVKRNTNFIFVY